MGNANSSQQQQQPNAGAASSSSNKTRTHHSSPSSSHGLSSPRNRNVSLSPTATISTTNAHASSSSSSAANASSDHKGTADPQKRRKKSIELSDVDPSLAFSSQAPATNHGRGARRKTTERTHGDIIIAPEDGEDPEPLGSGTLRGAMQGKAEHVVYGPRRPEPSVPTSASPTNTISATRPHAIALPHSNFSSASNSATPATPVDPDDTLHPDFAGSPRLTSAVLLSQDKMPVLVSPISERAPADSPLYGNTSNSSTTGSSTPTSNVALPQPQPPRSLSDVLQSINVATPITGLNETASMTQALPSITHPSTHIHASALQAPHTSPPMPNTSLAPAETVLAPPVPVDHLPISEADIPSGTGVIASPVVTPLPGSTPTGAVASPAVLLPPRLFNAPVAAIPIPLLSVPSATIAASLLAAAVDLGAGADGVPTLIKWKDEDGQTPASKDGSRPAKGPKEVFVTGTFAKGWQTKIELRKTDPSDFSALISLPPGPHRLKFIVDSEWKASKNLPVATDADGNLINYLQVNAADSKLATELWKAQSGNTTPAVPAHPATQSLWPGLIEDEDIEAPGADGLDDSEWTSEIPYELVEYGDWEAERDAIENSSAFSNPDGPQPTLPPPPACSGVPPPSLPAQLEKGPLNHAAYVTQGSGDDNSILPKPDHSVINHLAASPIKGGFLSVGVTTRYKRKFVTIVYYKALNARP